MTFGDVYGFTTKLRPLDKYNGEGDYQRELFRWHLVGVPQRIDTKLGDWISVVKLQQISNGGTGLSPWTYVALLNALEHEHHYDIDLDASYSSADVVPASWWVNSLIGDRIDDFEKGDLIALINGCFVSKGALCWAFERLVDDICDVFPMLGVANLQAHATTERELRFCETTGFLPSSNTHPQRSVFDRDILPLLKGILVPIADTYKKLNKSLMRCSANPLFVVNDGMARAYSSSTFLDFSTIDSVASLSRAVMLLARMVNRGIEESCEYVITNIDGEKDNPKWIQFPKITLGYCTAIETRQPILTQITGAESGGVEDLWDLGLPSVMALSTQLDVLDKVVAVSKECMTYYCGVTGKWQYDDDNLPICFEFLSRAISVL